MLQEKQQFTTLLYIITNIHLINQINYNRKHKNGNLLELLLRRIKSIYEETDNEEGRKPNAV